MKKPFVSVIIPVRNEELNLRRVLPSIRRIDYPKDRYEILVVDGGSTDGTKKVAQSFHAKLLHNPKGIRSAACNIGIQAAKGEYIAFTDADCIVAKHWIRGLLKEMKYTAVGSVGGPNITPPNDTTLGAAVGDVFSLFTRVGARQGMQKKTTTRVHHNPGCNVLYRKQAIIDAGGFDPTLITCEDEELDWRIEKVGYTHVYTPNVTVLHARRSTVGSFYRQAYRYAIGRMQAGKKYPALFSWYHFMPALYVALVIVSPLLAIFGNTWAMLPLIIYATSILGFLIVGMALADHYHHASWIMYSALCIAWIFGWGIGVWSMIFGISKEFRMHEDVSKKVYPKSSLLAKHRV